MAEPNSPGDTKGAEGPDSDDLPPRARGREKMVFTIWLSSALADAYRVRSVKRYGNMRGHSKLALRYILRGLRQDDEEERAAEGAAPVEVKANGA
jgi:hypothetical protein